MQRNDDALATRKFRFREGGCINFSFSGELCSVPFSLSQLNMLFRPPMDPTTLLLLKMRRKAKESVAPGKTAAKWNMVDNVRGEMGMLSKSMK